MHQDLVRQTIMKRAHRIHVLRKFINSFTLKCTALAGVLISVASLVSVSDIASNAMALRDSGTLMYYTKYAFMHTEFIVQLLLVSALGVILWLMKDVFVYSLASFGRVQHQVRLS